ncbi:receptor-like protein kinase FERONIA [Rutidosis leptorrhynchoides]|uniref:receptor-like protein kinase FERONIA n=1 Tax=Rutidosis leptorrhynchoides TaxID=125765 RepID=UPI003A999AF5
MDPFMKDFEHLKIDLEKIKLATRNFDKTQVIGSGGFGKVYKAEIKKRSRVLERSLVYSQWKEVINEPHVFFYQFKLQYSSIQGSLTSSYKSFTLEEIKRATNGFSDQNILGEGAFGKVFRGNISGTTYDGLVAVKRLNECSKQGQVEFQKEIELLSACNHPNIISLIGCCNEGSEKIIVYDFMKKGSLYDCVYIHKEQAPRLSVEQRLEICIGVAKGISYLHYGSQNNIIHSDLKTDNILLDADLVPKISDFGLSRTRVAGPSSSDVVTNTTKGTEGYIAPECYEPNYKVSRKADVYAFGVVLLEVLCERPPWERLLMLALPYIWRREFPKIAPEYVTMNISPGCSRVCVYILKDCLDNNPDNRPTINQVVDNLESASKLQKQESQANS